MLFLNSGERGNKKIGRGDLSITREKIFSLLLLNFYFIPSHGCVPLEFVFHRDYRVPYRRGMEIRGPPFFLATIGQISTEHTNSQNNEEVYIERREKYRFPRRFVKIKGGSSYPLYVQRKTSLERSERLTRSGVSPKR